ncbi:hypothetical protein [Nocardia grenadensis]|uniref:hypothetical protein n=1 Tax=Nocardia grenadensis TaxID=931537 RepID=UPI0012EEA7C8|nr:hypothetical protein [Nocardia grenadensis]
MGRSDVDKVRYAVAAAAAAENLHGGGSAADNAAHHLPATCARVAANGLIPADGARPSAPAALRDATEARVIHSRHEWSCVFREICDVAAKLPPHDTYYDNVPADHADYDIEDIPFPQENTPEQGVSKLLAVWGQGFESP